jgi:hypothetical protein
MDKLKKIIGTLAHVQISSALVWAAVMIGCSLVLTGTENSEVILNILIAGYTMHFLLLSKRANENEKMMSQR